jgi:uncharacterized protein YcbK (DUF882 family)
MIRTDLCYLGIFAALAAAGAPAFAGENGAVEVRNLHTRERLVVPPGRIPAPSVLNRFFRCTKDRRYTLMDPRPLMLAIRAARIHGAKKVVIISAFRTSRLNEAMRAEGRRVALRSRHVHGQALDVRIPGVPTETLCAYFRKQKLGGVGCYKGVRFIHIDVGPVRTWDG